MKKIALTMALMMAAGTIAPSFAATTSPVSITVKKDKKDKKNKKDKKKAGCCSAEKAATGSAPAPDGTTKSSCCSHKK